MSIFKTEKDKVGRDDLVTLNEISENAMIENIRKRYQEGIIYTSIGAVLISMNPYKDLGVFSKSNIDKYKGKQSFELPPHVFQLAEETYKSLLTEQYNQCIIISGESGAGKTEAAKGIMIYIAAVTGSTRSVDKVKSVILDSNPLLESFGNAKTLRNNNSSRFGKYIEILFDLKGDPIGGRVTNYLLEKTRVIQQTPGERNFHVFYQLFACKESSWGLGSIDQYNYLKKSNCTTADGINDSKWFSDNKHAMKTMGISDQEQDQIFKMLAGIIHLGNTEFTPGAKDSAKVKDPSVTNTVSNLFGVKPQDLEHALTHKTITSGSGLRVSTYKVPQNVAQSLYSRDALAKAIYSRIFDWLVKAINRGMEIHSSGNTIGILDIYGFEIFQLNSFEQLCINYVNETLHQIFIDLTLKAEQEEYKNEGIPWENVPYLNNKPTVDLLNGKPIGVFTLLDEECLFPNGTDMSFLEKCTRNFGGNKLFKAQRNVFSVQHYAGEVTYSIDQFLDKNRDTLFEDLKNLCLSSSHSVLQQSMNDFIELTTPKMAAKGGNKARPVTAGFQFKTSVAELLKSLYACHPHYIRTIKPNDDKAPLVFNDQRVREQARYLGLLENVKVRRAGYCYRTPYDRWLKRYGVVSPKTFPPRNYTGSARDGVQIILNELGITQKEYTFGNTKLFIREPQTLYAMEDGRLRALDKIAQAIKNSKPQPKKVQGNVCLEYLNLLIFEELGEFTITRDPKKNVPSKTYKHYTEVESDYVQGVITPQELKTNLFQIFSDITEPIRDHFQEKKKEGFLKNFFSFFSKGKQTTASLSVSK